MPEELRIGFMGAGGVNFGGAEGPWDHASRLEKLNHVRVVGIADPDTARAERVLAARRSGSAGRKYAQAKVFPDFRLLLDEARPDAVFIGLPPNAHGSPKSPKDIEMTCAAAGVHMLLEKPLGCEPPEKMQPVTEALARAATGGLIISVGYMFRYAKVVAKMREIIGQTPGGVRGLMARYDCAYSEIRKTDWWDVRCSGGPIVEQATHFCDLARMLAGEVDLASVRAVRIDPRSPVAALADMPALPDGGGLRLPRLLLMRTGCLRLGDQLETDLSICCVSKGRWTARRGSVISRSWHCLCWAFRRCSWSLSWSVATWWPVVSQY